MGKLPRGNRSPCCRQRDGRFQVAPVPWESIYASSHETQFGQFRTFDNYVRIVDNPKMSARLRPQPVVFLSLNT